MAKRGAKLGSSVLDLDIDDSKYTSNLERQRKRTLSWMDTLGRDVKRGIGMGVGFSMATGVANVVGGAIQGVKDVVAGSIAASMEWESAFAGVRKTVDASEEEFADLEGEIREMAKEMPIAATELAGLAEAAGALGIAKKDITEFTRVTALIGTTTDVSSDQAATSLGQLSNVLGLTGEDYERFASTLVDLGNKGASTESQILGIASRAGAGAKLIGMATEDTLAWSSAVANLGIEVEAGGSAVQKFFLDSAKAVSEGTDKLETYARVAGMTGAEFKRAFEEDASGALQTFLAGLGQLSQGDQLKVLEDLDFNDVRITRTLLGLAGNADNLGNSLDTATEAWEDNTAAAAEAEKRFGTSEAKLQVLGNRVNDLAIQFGDELLPGIVDAATIGVEALEWLVSGIGDFVDNVSDDVRWLQIYFGDLGATVEDRANEIGEDVGEMKDLVLFAMNEMGMGIDDATEYAERRLAGLPVAMSDAAKESYESWRQIEQNLQEPVEAGVAGAEAALLAGEDGVGAAADAIEQAMTKEMQEARDNAIDAMKAALAGMTNLIETESDLTAAWDALIERLKDPYTEAEREADTFSQTMIDTIDAAITAGDPKITADTAILVNNMLTQFALLEPGALETGTAVPPALQEGMDAQMGALITWIEQHVTGEALSAMTLEEAKQLGLDGIWLYAEGLRLNNWRAANEARAVASKVRLELAADMSSGGWSVISSWIGGMENAYVNNQGRIWAVVDGVKRSLGGSLPTEGPLAGGAGSGGDSIAEDWMAHLVGTIGERLPDLESVLSGVSDAMTIGPSVAMPTLSGIDGLMAGTASTFSGGGSITNITEYHMHYGGRERTFDSATAFMEELEGLARYDGASVGGR